MTEEECYAAEGQVRKLICPAGIVTLFNGAPLEARIELERFNATLPTEVANDDGFLRRVSRETTVRLFAVQPGEMAMLYEMGIPVVATGDKWHYDVNQKVPLSMERDSIPAAFLRALRVAALNAKFLMLEAADVTHEWVESAVGDSNCSAEAIQYYMDLKFGKKRVSYDPSDPEANKIAVSQGYNVVHGGMMSAGAWKNAKSANAIQPARHVTPSPKVWTGEDDPDAKIFRDWIPEDKWTEGMREVAAFARRVAERVLLRSIVVKFCSTPHHRGCASYGPSGQLVFNLFWLHADWFEHGITDDVVQLIIHEFGHNESLDHLSSEYHGALCRIGASMFELGRRGEL